MRGGRAQAGSCEAQGLFIPCKVAFCKKNRACVSGRVGEGWIVIKQSLAVAGAERFIISYFNMRIVLLLLIQIQTIVSCPQGSFSHTRVTCNLWDAWIDRPALPICRARISSPAGEFASHFSPPGSICELFLYNTTAKGRRFKFRVSHAFIDSSSSVKFFTCNSPILCNPSPVMTWSGVTWNPQSFPIDMSGYEFEIVANSKHIKIVLQTSMNSSSVASNTFALSWNNSGCKPCVDAKEDDGRWDPHVRQAECEQR